MAKPSQHRLLLTQEEFDWLQKNVPRHLKHVEFLHKKEPKKVTKRFVTSVTELAEKLAIPPTEESPDGKLVLITNRQDLRLLNDLLSVEHGALVTKVIPEYADRMGSDHARYKPYYDASLTRAGFLLNLLNNIKARIGAT